MDRPTKYLRRVQVGGTRHDGGQARGLDEIRGQNLFGAAGRSGSARGARNGRRLSESITVVHHQAPALGFGPLFAARSGSTQTGHVCDLDRAAASWTVGAPDLLPSGLAAAVGAMQRGESTLEEAASLLGVDTLVLTAHLERLWRLASQADHGRKQTVVSAAQTHLFAGLVPGAQVVDAGHLPVELTAAIRRLDVDALCTAGAARGRAEAAQRLSDPDHARLLRLQEHVRVESDLAAVRSDPELVRWGFDREDPGRTTTAAGESRWDGGLARCWRAIRLDERVMAAARSLLEKAYRGEADYVGAFEAIGLIGLWAPSFALRCYRKGAWRAENGLSVIRRAGIPPAPRSFAEWSPDVVLGMVRRNGWLTGDVEEANFTERALRPIRDGARRSPRFCEALRAWAERGEANGLIACMDEVGATERRTGNVLVVTDPDTFEVDRVTELSRQAWGHLVQSPLPAVRATLGERLFWRWPLAVIRDATKLTLSG